MTGHTSTQIGLSEHQRRRLPLCLFALVALLWPWPAHAAPNKLLLDRISFERLPDLRAYATVVDGEGVILQGHKPSDFILLIDSAEQGPAKSITTFDKEKEPIFVVAVVQVNPSVEPVLGEIKQGIRRIADSIGSLRGSRMGLLTYAGDIRRLVENGSAVEIGSAVNKIEIDREGTEAHMLDGVSIAIDLLRAQERGRRKLIVLFGDGINVNAEKKWFIDIGRKAEREDIIIDTIGYTPFDPTKLRLLDELSRQSLGTSRICKTPQEIGLRFANLADEIVKQYIVTFPAFLSGDNTLHEFQLLTNGPITTYSKTKNLLIPVMPQSQELTTDQQREGSGYSQVILLVVGFASALACLLLLRRKLYGGKRTSPLSVVPAPISTPSPAPSAVQPVSIPQPRQGAAIVKTSTDYVGPYRIASLIGSGGMGSVYLGIHDRIGARAAIKLLQWQHVKNQEMMARFFNEARALSIILHPGIVKIFDCGQLADGTAFMVMEYLEGSSLRARMQHSMGQASALGFAHQIADAVDAVHRAGIIHRDLKPENVMIVSDPAVYGGERAKVLDFGIAKVKPEQTNGEWRTQTGMIIGTPAYMSPEQCRGRKDIDEKTDVYSLGVMLYEMLAGRPPFSAEDPGEVISMHIIAPPRSLTETDSRIPEGTAVLVQRMLAKRPPDRPSMAEVRAAIEKLCPALVAGTDQPAVAGEAPVSVFYCYAQQDELMQEALEVHLALLRRQLLIKDWHRRKVSAGDDWRGQVDRNLNEAEIILLLISPNFIASDYCYEVEMRRALERHYGGAARVIPVLIRPVDWQGSPFADLAPLPQSGKAVTLWENQDEAWLTISRGIRHAVQSFNRR